MATHQPEKDGTITLRVGRAGNRRLKQSLKSGLAQLPDTIEVLSPIRHGPSPYSLDVRLTLQENTHEVAVALRQLADMIDQLHVDERAP